MSPTRFETPTPTAHQTYNDTLKEFALQYGDYRTPTVAHLDLFQRFDALLEYRPAEKQYYGPDQHPVNKALAQRVRLYSNYGWELGDSQQQALEQQLQAINANEEMSALDKLEALKRMNVPVSELPIFDEDLSADYWLDQVNNFALLSSTLRQQRADKKIADHLNATSPAEATNEEDDFDTHAAQALSVVACDNKQKAKHSRTNRFKQFSNAVIAAYNRPFDAVTSHIIEHPKTVKREPTNAEKSPSKVKAAYATVGAATMMGIERASTSTKEYFGHEEQGEKRRRVAKIAGAAALFGGGLVVGYLIAKGLYSGGKTTIQTSPEIIPTVPGQKVNDAATIVAGGSVIAHPSPETTQGVREVLHNGATIWGDSSHYLKNTTYGNSQSNVMKVTQWVLHNQHLSWNDARHLPVGYSFTMPPQDVLEELLKSK